MVLITVFIDGLKPESIEFMPFLNSLETKRRIYTEFGYSTTCHASMYTGVYPNKHLKWFTWEKDSINSPYLWLKDSGLYVIPEIDVVKYLSFKITKKFKNNTSYHGVTFLSSTQFKHWNLFSTSEKLFWDDNYIEAYPTIFDIFNKNKIPYDIIGMNKSSLINSSKDVNEYDFRSDKEWFYFFIGDVDPMSHRYGQESSLARLKLLEIDKILFKKYHQAKKLFGKVNFICFSDHGHLKVHKSINLEKEFQKHAVRLNDFVYIIDSTFARFWFNKPEDREIVENVLRKLDFGTILSDSEQIKHHVDMPDNRYGDLLFYLNAGLEFQRPFSPFLKFRNKVKNVSMHAYHPDCSEMDGVFISNTSSSSVGKIKLIDILPSHLRFFGLDIPEYIDGNSIW
jgi:predicted AlkP superfamily pyrophosphatase or phosphodiesterase